MYRRTLLALAVSPLLGFAACGDSSEDSAGSSAGSSDVIEVSIAASTPLEWPQIWIAEERDLWEKHGLKAKVTLFQKGAEALQSVVSGAADVATTAPTPLVGAVNAGQPIRVIAVTGRWSNWRVVGDKDQQIAAPADLAGKKIGVTQGTTGEVTLHQFLEDNGMSESDVEVVNVNPPDLASAISTGSIDAVTSWVPHIANAERVLGERAVSLPFEFDSNYLLTTLQPVIDDKREALSRVIKVFEEAQELLEQNPAEAAELVTGRAAIEAPALAEIWEEFTWLATPPDDVVRQEFTKDVEFFKDNGTIPEDADIRLDEILVRGL